MIEKGAHFDRLEADQILMPALKFLQYYHPSVVTMDAVKKAGARLPGANRAMLEEFDVWSDIRAAEKYEGFLEGAAIGKAEGKAEGKVEGKAETARRMLEGGFDVDTVVKYTQLDRTQIDDIVATIK